MEIGVVYRRIFTSPTMRLHIRRYIKIWREKPQKIGRQITICGTNVVMDANPRGKIYGIGNSVMVTFDYKDLKSNPLCLLIGIKKN